MGVSKGTVFQNLWASHETYFVYMSPVKSGRRELHKSGGYEICFIDGKWCLNRSAVYYTGDLQDSERFPVVGTVDIEKLLINGILKEVKDKKGEEYGK